VTPENIAFRYQVAGPFRRLPAYLVDFVIRAAILIGMAFVASFLELAIGGIGLAIWLIVLFVLSWFYGGLFEAYWNGQTPGKWMLGIRVLNTDGRPINGLQAVMRNFLRAVDMLPIVSVQVLGQATVPVMPTFMVGLVAMSMNRRYQRLGDLVCRTMVVVEDRPWLGGLAKIEDPRAFQLASHLPSDLRVSRSMSRALAHFAERRRYFSVPRRQEVAAHLAKPLLEQFRLPDDTNYDLLLCAMYYRLFIADRSGDESHAARAEAELGERSHFGGWSPNAGSTNRFKQINE
jgi:uncharacterized RDD family membrane protein YckC